ncbi:hypothetical protein JCM6882_000971 [Rhodosporidiobolus microsporus]
MSGRGSSSRPHGPATTSNLESTITRLLVATKQLLEGLAKWSRGEVNEEAISAIYVKLGNDFNVACAAFAKEGISMNELLSVPSQLRVCLETCLSDTPSQATLERHLPEVRQIIIGLLHGLREKQRLYRDGVAARRAREKAASAGGTQPAAAGGSALNGAAGPGGQQASGLPLTPNSAGRSRDELRRFVSHAQQQQHPPSNSSAPYDSDAAGGARPRFSDGSVPSSTASGSVGRRSASEMGAGGDSRLSAALPSRTSGSQRSGSMREFRTGSGDTNGSKRSSRSTLEDIGFMPPSASSSSAVAAPAMPRSNSSASLESMNSASARPSSAQSQTHSHGGSRTPRMQSPPPPQRSRDEPPVPRTPTMDSFGISTNPPPTIPSTVVRPPSIASTLSSHSAEPPAPPTVPLPPPIPQAQSASLEALKTSDHLSRRASKRYSAYAIQKMTSPVPSSSGSGGLSPGGGDGEGGGSPRTDKVKGRDFASPTFGGADVRRSKSEHYQQRASTRPTGSGLGRGVPPVPGIPRSWSSQQNLRGGAGGSPIVEEEEEEGGSPAMGRSPPSFIPPAVPPVPSTTGDVPRSGSAPTLSSSIPASSNTLSPGPAYPPHLGPRSPSPALPPLPTDQSPPIPFSSAGGGAASTTPRAPPPLHSPSPPPSAVPSFPWPIFLRIGPSVRKATLSSPPNDVQDLRQLFVERFGYHPGVEGWPEVYVQDEKTGVRYELEDMEEVREGCVLSLNVDAVEQVKHHIDSGLSSLAQDIKELRATVTAMRRLSVPPPHAGSAAHLSPNAASEYGEERGMRPSPSQKQFEQAAQNVLRMRRLGSTTSLAVPQEEGDGETKEGGDTGAEKKDEAAVTKQPPGRSATDPFSPTTAVGPIVDTLKSQHAEVTNLRREIGVLRQVYVDFTSQTKSMFASVRVQTSHLHGLAQSKLSTDRAFVEAGTSKLESESTDLVVRVDELQDTIEQLRADLVDRGVKPRPQQLSETASALRKATEQRVKLDAWLKEVKPSWSQMWSVELSKILSEQKAVETQQVLLGELEEDLQDADKVLRDIQGASKHLRSSASSASSSSAGGAPNGSGLRPVRREFGSAGGDVDSSEAHSTVMMEVRALQPDPTKRLEAIARAEKEREKHLANRTDEFAEELGDFVGKGKLKKSGGIEEAERLRQKRSEATLKAMFSS